jgi:tetratricopeptide (TPR) repeat protein
MNLATALSLHQSGRRAEAASAYLAVLEREPENAHALHAYGVLRQQAGASAEAEELIARAIALQPHDATFHFNLGLARYRQQKFDQATEALREAIRLKPAWPQPHYDLGNALNAAGQREAAARAFRAALKLKPDFVQAEVNLANVLKAQGKQAQAIAAYRRVLRRDASLAEVHHNLGVALLESGERSDGEAALREAVRLRPDFAEALASLAAMLIADTRFAEAAPVAAAARAAAPDRAGFCELHADALRGAAQYDAALAAYHAALALEPGRVSARFGMAEAHRLNRDLDAAEALLRPLVAQFPKTWQAHHDLANVVRHQGRFAEAEAGFRAALALQESADTLAPLGMVLRDLQRLEESTDTLERARRLKPHDQDILYNLSTTHLTAGRLREGFALYDSRFVKFRPRPLPGRGWTGERVQGRAVLVAAEQGFGDTLHFMRYVPKLAEAGARVVLRVQPPLLRLLNGFPGVDTVISTEAALPPFDLHVSIMSLPHRLGVADPMPIPVPYLRADVAATEGWRARLAALPGRRVGIVWSGNPGFGGDHLRSIAPRLLSAFGAVPGVSFVSLQKGGAAMPPLAMRDWTADLADFADTAALIAALDLVISVDTSVAHLAGGLGCRVWLLNRFDTCWRWLTDRPDSIWYPAMRIFRQTAPGDWSVPLAQAAAALRDWAEA